MCDLVVHGGGALVCFSILVFTSVFVHFELNDGSWIEKMFSRGILYTFGTHILGTFLGILDGEVHLLKGVSLVHIFLERSPLLPMVLEMM